MDATPLRIGVWFNVCHCSYGGPTLVLLGTILGLFQDAEQTNSPIIIVLNEPGDVNWCIDYSEDYIYMNIKAPNAYIGPLVFSVDDGDADSTQHSAWNNGSHFIFPSEWLRYWVSQALPFLTDAEHRTHDVWGAGVDTDFFRPLDIPKTQDYFIYFKSQNFADLSTLNTYLFKNFFGIRGSVIIYYNYDACMLRQVANNSRFCILLDNPETQGLAALEIMACNIPLFVLDISQISGKRFGMSGCTSVTCWDQSCGMKSSMKDLECDFPIFMTNVENYKPRAFVESQYSFSSAAHTLRGLITRKHHQCENNNKEDSCMQE